MQLPEDFTSQPLGFIALTGLDIKYNAIHRSIWDSFTVNRRPDRVPLHFNLLSGDYEYRKPKSKRSTYEWYIPKGIIKMDWMQKHINEIPSVLVIFYDLDWNDPQWKEKQVECVSRVEIARSSLQGRNTKIAVVLIQTAAPLPPGEDMVAAERAATLCTACELSSKSLFVLPHNPDHLYGYIIRLENAYYELSQAYYHGECRRVKSRKELLNKQKHEVLIVRHQFKIAFFCELRQDRTSALKHYKLAYSNLKELEPNYRNMLETKLCASFFNYKICRLCFLDGSPVDAIAQFRSHVDYFKKKSGYAELAFIDAAWISHQYSIFGDLFDEAVKNGLDAIQTQHPGFYYQYAACCAIFRKQLCYDLCQAAAMFPVQNTSETTKYVNYYGQRVWNQGYHSMTEASDADFEKAGILAVQTEELKVDHSYIIIQLFSKAVSQFKKYKSSRMRRHLMIKMAEEYYHAKDYVKALALLDRVAPDYRSEKWWDLLTAVLNLWLKCAYLLSDVQNYVTVCVEMISKHSTSDINSKSRIQKNLLNIIQGKQPDPESDLSAVSVEEASKLWIQKFAMIMAPMPAFDIDISQLASFVECKVSFGTSSFTADVPIIINVYLRSSSPLPIRFHRLSLKFNIEEYNNVCSIINKDTDNEESLLLIPNQLKCVTFKFVARSEDVGESLEVSTASLQLGDEKSYNIVMTWNTSSSALTTPTPTLLSNVTNHPEVLSFDQIQAKPATKLTSRKPLIDLKLQHEPPALVNEYYSVKLLIQNDEKAEISDVRSVRFIKCDLCLAFTAWLCIDNISDSSTHSKSVKDIHINNIASGEKVSKLLFVKCQSNGQRVISVKITYKINIEVDGKVTECKCKQTDSVTIETAIPFETVINTVTTELTKVDALCANEPYFIMACLKSVSPWPITILNSTFNLINQFESVDTDTQSQLSNVSLQKSEEARECFAIKYKGSIEKSKLNIGKLRINWKRSKQEYQQPEVETDITLPTVLIDTSPIYIVIDKPAYGCLRTALPVTYELHNRTNLVQEVEINIDPCESFMFTGLKQVNLRILPSDIHALRYVMYPLTTGYVTLPRLKLNLPRYQSNDSLGKATIAAQVLVKVII
ncbi:uncharacterized protein TRIADDRAFT_30200 [Trichoplax adhaerens]|uniref:Trafficking protein particle complex subunit 11 n=1 Tax=Trichoplax adhaerens TaxID=10228 RepID=B3S6B6_TRIAD|nr:hypothetical protein TRIADDRAFT_30200 [Trichoplax adhaerens]EDV21594.1 hypothetical protein TRIADDRAFT_30200 [Trichoplax adhaerens]|eukprot:XP_002115742.1 hypothetical protein TRIADDRAFT_30200 [Trichoplax adhaerens]